MKPHDVSGPKIGNSPKHLRELYNSTGVEGKAPDNKMAVTAFLNQYYKLSDLKEFWKLYCKDITCGKGDPKLVGDATHGLFSGVEAMLDIESITGVAGNVESEFWGFSGKSPDDKENEPFMKWLSQVSNTSDADVPKLFSTSYGEDEKSWSSGALDRMNAEFMKAGTRGITLLYAAGDEGANCEDDKFVPETPGSSPYVTAVGGTTGVNTESAVGLSSGGFSDHWPMPDYQKEAVDAYLKSDKLPPASRGYNVSGRAYPDISAQATDFTVVANGIPNPGVAGTSCASPTASGIIALLNDARLQANKSTMGFLNPFVYKNIKLWNDITTGSSSGCSFDDGWPAVAGWDAVTGCGTPNYQQLVQAALE
jgi:tripeptidyl-peptidase-1